MRRALLATALAGTIACGGTMAPAALDTTHDTCASCRMVVSDWRLASQVVAAGEEPRFFDDLACLREYLGSHEQADAAVFVADHRTGDWTAAMDAVFSRLTQSATPMASGFVAHASAASREADASASNSRPVSLDDVFGPAASRARR